MSDERFRESNKSEPLSAEQLARECPFVRLEGSLCAACRARLYWVDWERERATGGTR